MMAASYTAECVCSLTNMADWDTLWDGAIVVVIYSCDLPASTGQSV